MGRFPCALLATLPKAPPNAYRAVAMQDELVDEEVDVGCTGPPGIRLVTRLVDVGCTGPPGMGLGLRLVDVGCTGPPGMGLGLI